MYDIIEQSIILICSGISIFMFASQKSKVRFIGFIIAICGQPFWWFTSWRHGQWGILILSVWFTINHIRGIINNRKKDIQ